MNDQKSEPVMAHTPTVVTPVTTIPVAQTTTQPTVVVAQPVVATAQPVVVPGQITVHTNPSNYPANTTVYVTQPIDDGHQTISLVIFIVGWFIPLVHWGGTCLLAHPNPTTTARCLNITSVVLAVIYTICLIILITVSMI